MNKTTGGIYYTDWHCDPKIMEVCQNQLRENFPGEIVSVSLKKPLDFGKNIVIQAERSYPTMALQIFTALEASTADYVFFLEHDVLYAKSHFDFVPPKDDIYYYDDNSWRWPYLEDFAITWDHLVPLSMMCVNRRTALKHYKYRLELIEKWGLDKIRSREPRWARRFGYEPGSKKIHRGGVTDEDSEAWTAPFPSIDIRHSGTFTRAKIYLNEFKHQPVNFREIKRDEIPGWDLKKLFNL
jgi:hypothetical protein